MLVKSKRSSRYRSRHSFINGPKIVGLTVVTILLLLIVTKYPFIKEPRKQYVVKSGGEVEKVPASSEAGEVSKTIIESVVEDSKMNNRDLVVGNEFAKIGVLDYFPGGYHVAYPEGFVISYTPNLFEAKSPAGGGVTVTITGGQFSVQKDFSGSSSDQQSVIEAAAKLISNSFRFLDGSGYNLQEAKDRFAN